MTEGRSPYWLVLLLGLGLGIAGDLLLRQEPWGLNYTIWMCGFLGASALVTRISPLHSGLAIPIAFFAGCLVWRDSEFLWFWNVVASCSLFVLPLIQHAGRSLRTAWLADYVRAGLLGLRSLVWGAVSLLLREQPWEQVPEGSLRVTGRILVGAVFATPLLLIFGGLFSSADPAFGDALTSLLRVDLEEAFGHVAATGVITAGSIGYLASFLLDGRNATQDPSRPPIIARFGIVEVAIPLGALILLFGAFLTFQIPYLFGGASFVAQEGGMTYADYARRGFFELTAASGLVLPLLLGAHWVVDSNSGQSRLILHVLAAVQIALVCILMISALHRMSVYVSVFGLSTDRIYATAFMAWTGSLFGWFTLTVLRGARRRFAFGAVVSGLVVLAGLNFLNPDGLVARTQLARGRAGAEIDPAYLVRLSGDAVPFLVEGFDILPAEARCMASERITQRWSDEGRRDWRTWNIARTRARRAVASSALELERQRCPASS